MTDRNTALEQAAKVAKDYAEETNEDGTILHKSLCIWAATEIERRIRALIATPEADHSADVVERVALHREARNVLDWMDEEPESKPPFNDIRKMAEAIRAEIWPPLRPVANENDAEAMLAHPSRSPRHRTIYRVLRDYRMGNMVDEDGYGYPLVDLMSNPAPADIGTGMSEMVALVDEIIAAMPTATVRETAIRHDERKKIIANGCIHTVRAGQQTETRSDIQAWQEAQHEFFDDTILGIVEEYADWRDRNPS